MNQLVVPKQQGWVWNGTSWVCDPDDVPPFPGCPPPGFPPPGCPPWFPPPQGQPPWYPGANAGVTFSATAPPNPVRGAFWWNGSLLQMFDGAAWVIIGGSGNIAGALTVETFSLQIPDNPVITAGTWTIFPFSASPTLDTMSAWKAGFKYQPSQNGIYQFAVGFGEPGAAAEGLGMMVLKNDPGTFTSGSVNQIVAVNYATLPAGGGFLSMMGQCILNGTTDFIRVWALSQSGNLWGLGNSPAFVVVKLP